MILNSPVNPTGVVVSREDLELLAAACRARSVPVICDEVWEHLVFDGATHTPLIALPGMADLAVKIGSAGKMFGLTGWKVGFLCAGPALSPALARAHQFLTFTTPPNLQAAVAFGLETPGDWFTAMPARMQASRDRLAEALKREGFSVARSQGTAIPVSAFYETEAVTRVLRLCFAKADDVLDAASTRLARARDLSVSASRGA